VLLGAIGASAVAGALFLRRWRLQLGITAVSNLNVSAQVALPDWVRGRGLAMYVTVMFGKPACIVWFRALVLRHCITGVPMAVSARLGPKTQLALARYCKAHGLTKTEALERGIALLLKHEGLPARHPAYTSFERLRAQLAESADRKHTSTDDLKRHLDEKYPG